MRLYNSLTNEYFDFTQLNSKNINWYCCGPTIYNDSHLGHARTYIIFDTMCRYLRSQGFYVNYGMNITDIDDKIINKVNLLNGDNKDIQVKRELYQNFIDSQLASFWSDMHALNISPPQKYLRVTHEDVMLSIMNFVKKLIEDGYAYIGLDVSTPNKSVYFNVDKYSDDFKFNCLHCANYCDQITKNTHIHDKKSPKDFAIWKAVNDSNELSWTFSYKGLELGQGRPGWHIECSAIMKLMFGTNVHIHSGGIDLKYPHHNNEFLQSSSYFGRDDWVKCFVHSGHLHINGEKMSQSLGNFITIKQFLTKYNSNEIRLMFLSSKYSDQMDLNEEICKYGQATWGRIRSFLFNLDTQIKSNLSAGSNDIFDVDLVEVEFIKLLADDFNTPEAIKLITRTIDTINSNKFGYSNLAEIYQLFSTFLNVLGMDRQKSVYKNSTAQSAELVDIICQIRNKIKTIAKTVDKETKAKLFGISDNIRDKYLPNAHVKLEDLPNGQVQWCWHY